MTTVVGEATVRATIELDEKSAKKATDEAAKNIENGLQRAGRSISGVGRAMTIGLTAPIVGAAGGVVKLAADFEREMIRVQIVTEATGTEMTKLTDLARELGANTVFSAGEAAEGMSALGRAGFSTDEIMKGIRGTLALAATEQMDLGRAAEITAQAVRAMGLRAEDAGRVADVLASGANESLASVEGLGNALGYTAGQARLQGLSLEQTVGFLSALSDAGIDASRSGTSLNQMLRNLSAPTKKLGTQLKKFGLDVRDKATGEMRNLEDVFRDASKLGPDAMNAIARAMDANASRAFLELSERAGKADGNLTQLVDKMRGAEGEAERMGKALTGGTAGAMEELSSAIEGLAISIASSGLLQMFTDIVKGITQLIDDLAKSNPEMLKFAGIFALIVAAIGPALVAIGAVVSAVGAIGGAIAGAGGLGAVAGILGPIALVVAAIAALAIGLKTAYDQSKPFRDFVIGLGKAFAEFGKGFSEQFMKAMDQLGPFLEKEILPTLREMGATLERLFTNALPYIEAAIPVFKILGQAIGAVFGATLSNLIGGVIQLFTGLGSFLVNTVDFWVKLFSGDLQGSFEALVKAFQGLGQALLGLVRAVFGGFIQAIKDIFKIASPSKVLLDIATDVMNGFINGIMAMIGAVVSTVNNLVQAVTKPIVELAGKALQWGKDMLTKLISGIGSLIGSLSTKAGEINSTVAGKVAEIVSKMVTYGKDIVGKLISGIGENIGSLGTKAGEIVSTITGKIGGLYNSAYNVGKDIVTGMTKGITDFVGGLARTAADMANSAIRAAQNALDSHSPSRKFYDLGQDGGEGMALGFQSKDRRVAQASADMASGSVAAAAGATGSAVAPGVVVNQNYYGPQTPAAKAREIDLSLRFATKAYRFPAGAPA